MFNKLIFILLYASYSGPAWAKTPPSQLFTPSHFSACRELNLSFLNTDTKRNLDANTKIASALDAALTQCRDRRHFVIDPTILSLGPEIEKSQFLQEIRSTLGKAAKHSMTQTQIIQSCFDPSTSQYGGPKCELIRKEERQHLGELSQKARRLLALAHPYTLHSNRQQPFGQQAYQVPALMIDESLKKSSEHNSLDVTIPLTESEKHDTRQLLSQNKMYQDLVGPMRESSYQERPTSQKNMEFHHQIPARWKQVEDHFTSELHQLLTLAPSLKYILPQYDPRKAEPISDEQFNRAYQKLLKDYKTLEAQRKNPSNSYDDCFNLQSSVVNQVLAEKIKRNKERGKQYCQLAENLLAACEQEQKDQEVAHILGLGGICLFASPVVCGIVGAGDLGAEWAQEHEISRRMQMEHSAGVRNWSDVTQQSHIEAAIKNGAPLALVGIPSAGFLAATRKVLRTQRGLNTREQVNQLFTNAQKGSESAISEIKKAEQQVLKENYELSSLTGEEESSLYQLAKENLIERFENKLSILKKDQRGPVLKKVLQDVSNLPLETLPPARRKTLLDALIEIRSSKLTAIQKEEKASAIKKCFQKGDSGLL